MQTAKSVVATVFIALVLDLLAFTLPLPLFPRLIAWYTHRESHDPSTLLSRLLALSHSWRSVLLSRSRSGTLAQLQDGNKNWDVVLLGGAMGSLFSFCQCIISPQLGKLSDRYGRKRVLVATMLGNILSAVIWLRSTTFASFLLSRLVGGLSEGNVQLSTAIISDVTTASTRSKSLALVGIAFSVCFTFGPSLGAYFASRPLSLTAKEERWNVYATPAAISLGFLVVETLFLIVKLPETRNWRKQPKEGTKAGDPNNRPSTEKESTDLRLARLRTVGWFHCAFLLFFSGAEFTLTFLTYDLFGATNAQNGRLLSYIGVLAAMLQARHVRPALAKKGELQVASNGLFASTISFFLLAILPLSSIRSSGTISTIVLYGAATGLAYVSATVVTGLTAAAASCCDEESQGGDNRLRRGQALGGFRSKGQLGRAVGPILASSVYWMIGPSLCYGIITGSLSIVSLGLRSQLSRDNRVSEKKPKSQ